MTPTMQAALSGRRAMIVGLIDIDLPGYHLSICDGGWVDHGGRRYLSRDARFGTVQSVEDFTDGVGDEAPAGQLTFLPASTSAAVQLSSPAYQGSALNFAWAVVDEMTGKIIAEPDLIFDGELDTTTLNEERAAARSTWVSCRPPSASSKTMRARGCPMASTRKSGRAIWAWRTQPASASVTIGVPTRRRAAWADP